MDETWPTNRWFITRAMLRIADAAMLIVVLVVGQAVLFPSSFGQPMGGPQANAFGMPVGVVFLTVGIAGVVIGWVWIHRIARGEPEPEANDRFWWSRT